MANYTTKEIQAVVDGLVRSTVRRPYDTLGTRRTDVTFSDIQESAASVFLLYPRSPLYLASLSGQRALEVYEGIKDQLSKLNQSLAILRRRSLPVRDVSSLVNAKVALFELESAVSSNAPKDLTKIPAYVRFNSNVDRFLSAVGSNVKKDGEIVQTPEEARNQLSSLVTDLKGQVEDFLERCTLLANALSDYNSLGLPQLVSKTVVSNTRQLLATRADQLATMKESDRLLVLRDTVLEVLSAKAVVKGFGAFAGLGANKGATGNLTPVADTGRPGIPASVTVPLSSALSLVIGPDESTSSNLLKVWLDGTAVIDPPTTSFYLPASTYPKVEGSMKGPYLLGYDSLGNNLVGTDLENDKLKVSVTLPADTNLQKVTLTLGELALGSVQVGDSVTFRSGSNTGAVRLVTSVHTTGTGIDYFQVDGSPLATTTGTDTVQVTLPVNFTPNAAAQTAQAVANQISTALANTGYEGVAYFSPLNYDGLAETDGTNLLVPVFGYFMAASLSVGDQVDFYAGLHAGVTRTVTSVTTDGSGNITGFFVDGAPLSASVENRIQYGPTRKVRIEAVDKAAAILGRYQVQIKQPTQVEINTGGTLGFIGEVSGRGRPSPVSFLTDYVTKNSTQVTAELAQDSIYTGDLVTATSDAQTVTGTIPGIAVDMTLVVPSGPNAGRYVIDSVSTGSFKLRTALPYPRDQYNQGITLKDASIGFDSYTLRSTNTTLTSSIAVQGPGDGGAIIGPTAVAYGTTPYVSFSGASRLALEGDQIQLFETDPNTPSFSGKVLQVFSDDVLLLDAAVPMNGSWSFSSGAVPFARLVSSRVGEFETLSSALLTELSKNDSDSEAYFKDLNRFINPLKVNTNPTDSDVGAAENRVADLATLLENMAVAIRAYQPAHVPQMDELIKTFRDKGADRAVNLLLSCAFSTFFGLSQEETSYAGTFQKAVREVAMNDLPVHKTNRAASYRSQLVSIATSTDYEDSTEDLDRSPVVDPPVSIDSTST